MKLFTARTVNFISFLFCCGLIGFAYYLQTVLNLQPCPLCVLERIVFAILATLFLLAALQNPGAKGQKIYGSLLLFFAIAGMGFAVRHLWLQGQPPGLGEVCVPGISFLLKSLPLSQAIQTLFLGTADCAKVDWTFLGLSIPGWTFLFFDIFALLAIALIKGLLDHWRTFFNKQTTSQV